MGTKLQKAKNKRDIATELAKNPFATNREIGQKTGLNPQTISLHKKEMGNMDKSEFILDVMDLDKTIIMTGLRLIYEKILKNGDKMRASEISHIIKENTARYALFSGLLNTLPSNTNVQILVKDINKMEIVDIQDNIKQILKN